MKTINVKLTGDKIVSAPIIHETEYYLVINDLDSEGLLKGYQVVLNKEPFYPTISKIKNKRFACRLANYLQKSCNNKAILYGNKYYIKNIVKDLVVTWLLDRRVWNSTVGRIPLSEVVQ